MNMPSFVPRPVTDTELKNVINNQSTLTLSIRCIRYLAVESSVTNQNMVTSIQTIPITGLSTGGVGEASVVNTGFDPFDCLSAGSGREKPGYIDGTTCNSQ